MIHEIKIRPEYFDAVAKREKTFELRRNDRNYKKGDYLVLKEWDGYFTGRVITRYVNYILFDWMVEGLESGYCIMNLKISHLHAVLDETNKGGEQDEDQ